MTTLDELGFYTLTGSAGQRLELLTDAALIPDLLTAALRRDRCVVRARPGLQRP